MSKEELVSFLHNDDGLWDKEDLIETLTTEVLLSLGVEPVDDQTIGTSMISILEYTDVLFDRLIDKIVNIIDIEEHI